MSSNERKCLEKAIDNGKVFYIIPPGETSTDRYGNPVSRLALALLKILATPIEEGKR